MTRQMTLGNSIAPEQFDPMSIDISEFDELAKSMPRDANLDIPVAEKLAVQYLRAADRCSEILATLMWMEGRAKIHRNSLRERLYLEAKDHGHKTVRERDAFSESHPDFIAAEEALNNAMVARNNFKMRHKWFLDGHQYMKERLRGEYRHQTASGFSETVGDTEGVNSTGEQSWGEKKW